MSPETAVTGGDVLFVMWLFTLESVCDQWASTDEGTQGEADITCLYTGDVIDDGFSMIKIFLTKTNT